jgi:FkbM family methyltransferase
MGILKVLKFVTNHPLNRENKFQAVKRFLKWQIHSRLNPHPVIYPFTEKAKLVIEKGMTGATGNIYCGLHEFNDMTFLLHFLRPGDLFVDIGANIGSFTMLASAHVGAHSIAIEPVLSTYENLRRNILVNGIQDLVTTHNIAMGSTPGTIKFTRSMDTMNHVATKEDTDFIDVEMDTLDNILEDKEPPALLKIDVEGFETEVIRGGMKTLRHPELKAIIIELPGFGKRYGYDESKLHDQFIKEGFKPHHYKPLERQFIPVDKFGSYNTLYIKDIEFVSSRVVQGPKINILDRQI